MNETHKKKHQEPFMSHGAALATALGGGLLLAGGLRNYSNGSKVVDAFEDVARRLHKAEPELWQKGTQHMNPEELLGYLRDYGAAAQTGLRNKPLMGIGPSIGDVLETVPPSSFVGAAKVHEDPLQNLLIVSGLKEPENEEQLLKMRDAKSHYANMGTDSGRLLAKEILTEEAAFHPSEVNQRLLPEAAAVVSPEEADKIISAPGTLVEKFQPYLAKMRQAIEEAPTPEAKEEVRSRFMAPLSRRADKLLKPDTEDPTSSIPHAYAKLTSGLTHLTGTVPALAGAGALGYGAYSLDKIHEKQAEDEQQPLPTGTLATGMGLGGLGLASASKAQRLQSGDLVLATGGRMGPPIWYKDTGEGHVAPAEALYEALQEIPEDQRHGLIPEILLRTQRKSPLAPAEPTMGEQLLEQQLELPEINQPLLKNKHIHGKSHVAAQLNTGFGYLPSEDAVAMNALFKTYEKITDGGAATSAANAIASATDEVTHAFGANHGLVTDAIGEHQRGHAPFIAPFYLGLLSKPSENLTTFGESSKPMGFDMVQGPHFKQHPALRNQALQSVESLLKLDERFEKDPTARKTHQMQVLTELHDGLDKMRAEVSTENPTLAGSLERDMRKLKNAVADGKHIFTVTGSSRGDHMHRATQLAKALRNSNGKYNSRNSVVLAMLGNGYSEDWQHKLLNGYDEIVKVPHTRYIDPKQPAGVVARLTHASEGVLGSPGASAVGEARMISTPTVYASDMIEENKKLVQELKDHGAWTPELEKDIMSVSMPWIGGNVEGLKETRPSMVEDTAHGFLQKLESGELKRDLAYAKQNFEGSVKARRDMAQWLYDRGHANNLRNQSVRKLLQGSGAALTGTAAGMLLAKYLMNREKSGNKEQSV